MQIDAPPGESDLPPRQVVTLCFFRFGPTRDRLWAFGQMALARRPLRRLPGAGFVKLMGAGTGEGFTPVPNTGVVAILATWPDLATARRQIEEAGVFQRYRARAVESFVLWLAPLSTRGRWSDREPFTAADGTATGPVAVLTRASVRPRVLLKFWRRVPDISTRIGRDPNVLFKAGIGEVPWLHQVTFSVWPDIRSMSDFARAGGPHAEAIRAVRTEGWFSEELYARFAVLAHAGTWGGRDPLAGAAPVAMAAE
jgi:spheroidene monooxygenase